MSARGLIAAADKIEARIVEAEKLRAALEEIKRLHAPRSAMCDECYGGGCRDCEDAGGWQICSLCCLDEEGDVLDNCIACHQHTNDIPACSTAEIIARAGL